MGTLFALLFGRAFDKMGKKANICPKLTKNAYFGPILAVFGPKILIFMGVSKSFGTNITENHLDNLSALFFGQALDQMGQKCRYLAKNVRLGPNFSKVQQGHELVSQSLTWVAYERTWVQQKQDL